METGYLGLVADILENGVKKSDRTGTGTLSVFGRLYRHNLAAGFPLYEPDSPIAGDRAGEFIRRRKQYLEGTAKACHAWARCSAHPIFAAVPLSPGRKRTYGRKRHRKT